VLNAGDFIMRKNRNYFDADLMKNEFSPLTQMAAENAYNCGLYISVNSTPRLVCRMPRISISVSNSL